MNIYQAAEAYWATIDELIAAVPAARVFGGRLPSGKAYPLVMISTIAGPTQIGSTTRQTFHEETIQITIRDNDRDRAVVIRDLAFKHFSQDMTKLGPLDDDAKILIWKPGDQGLAEEAALIQAFNQYVVTTSKPRTRN